MYTKLKSYSLLGLESVLIDIEVTVNPGLAKFEIIGLADASIRESRERIFHSIKRHGYEVPPGNITVNLAPGELKKTGTNYDLAIALGILLSSGQIASRRDLSTLMISGELTLDGNIRNVNGIFNTAITFRKKHFHYLIPEGNTEELFAVLGAGATGIETLQTAVEYVEGEDNPSKILNGHESKQASEGALRQAQQNEASVEKEAKSKGDSLDYIDVCGNEMAKQAIQLAIVGRMNLLLIGPPGCGKSMLLKRIPTIVEDLPQDKAMDVTRIHLARGEVFEEIIKKPPFREVHSTASTISIVGGGSNPKPGEISLAHHGYLFMDELSEFNTNTLQSLRNPMEQKQIKLDRVQHSITYPCDFSLVATTNPCRCGYYGDSKGICTCSRRLIQHFYSKLSGPLLDRFDLIVYVARIRKEDFEGQVGLSSMEMKQNIVRAKESFKTNSPDYLKLSLRDVMKKYAFCKEIFMQSLEQKIISLRRVRSVLRVASALEALDGKEFSEALLLKAIELSRYQWSND